MPLTVRLSAYRCSESARSGLRRARLAARQAVAGSAASPDISRPEQKIHDSHVESRCRGADCVYGPITGGLEPAQEFHAGRTRISQDLVVELDVQERSEAREGLRRACEHL